MKRQSACITMIALVAVFLTACAGAGAGTEIDEIGKTIGTSDDTNAEVDNSVEKTHEHDFVAVSNNDGTHTYKCECGEIDKTENCTLNADDICTVCGYQYEHNEDIMLTSETITLNIGDETFHVWAHYNVDPSSIPAEDLKVYVHVSGENDDNNMKECVFELSSKDACKNYNCTEDEAKAMLEYLAQHEKEIIQLAQFHYNQEHKHENRTAIITNENGEKLYTFINGTPLTEEEAIKEIVKASSNRYDEEYIRHWGVENFEYGFDGTLSDDKSIEQIIKEQFGFNDEQIRNIANSYGDEEAWKLLTDANSVYGDKNGLLSLRGMYEIYNEAIKLGYIKPEDAPAKLAYWLNGDLFGEDKASADHEIHFFKGCVIDPGRLVPYVEGQMTDYMTGHILQESAFGGYNGDGYYGHAIWIWRDPDNGNILALNKKDYNYFKYGEVESYATHLDHGYADN